MTSPPHGFTAAYLRYALGLLALANFVNYMDRMVLSVVLEQVRQEFALSDTQCGVLVGLAFSIFYGTVGLLIARLADRHSRTRLIAASMLLWSALTALTGAVQNFWQLFLTRIGVGVGEAGVIPAANSLLADYFSPARRPAALAVFSAGATLGLMAGLSLGGWAAEHYGWRWAFVIAGAPAVPLSLVVWKTLREPTRGLSDGAVAVTAPTLSFAAAIAALLRRKTYLHTVIAACFVNFIVYGTLQWMPTFVIRKFGLDVAEVGFFFGVAFGLGSALGAVLGGYAVGGLVERDARWLIRIPFIIGFVYLPAYELAIFSSSTAVTFGLIFAVSVVGGVAFGPMLAVLQSVTPPAMRATAAAVHGFMVSLIGVGGGAFVIGLLSDVFAASVGAQRSLQMAMAVAVTVSVMIPLHFGRASRTFIQDMIAPASATEASLQSSPKCRASPVP